MSPTLAALSFPHISSHSRPSGVRRLIVILVAFAIAAAAGWAAVAAQEPEPEPQPTTEPPVAPQVQLFKGWNNVPYTGLSLPLPDALNDARGHVTTVWQHVAQTQEWRVWQEGLPPAVASLMMMETGGVYFVQSTTGGMWTHPLAPPTELPAPPTPEVPPAEWELTFSRSADAFGLAQTLSFDATGSGAAGNSGAEQALNVNAAALAAVDGLLRANGFFGAWPTSTVTGCGGCFLYEITIHGPSGGVTTLQADDLGLTGALFTLVEQLSAILIPLVG